MERCRRLGFVDEIRAVGLQPDYPQVATFRGAPRARALLKSHLEQTTSILLNAELATDAVKQPGT